MDDAYFEAPCYLAIRHNSQKEEAVKEDDETLQDLLKSSYLVYSDFEGQGWVTSAPLGARGLFMKKKKPEMTSRLPRMGDEGAQGTQRQPWHAKGG